MCFALPGFGKWPPCLGTGVWTPHSRCAHSCLPVTIGPKNVTTHDETFNWSFGDLTRNQADQERYVAGTLRVGVMFGGRFRVERVLGHLIRQGAIGAVTTHDLELASSPILKGACQTVHFRESFASENDNQRMKFDYHLHPGVATTRNALKLLEMVGLAEEWETCLQVNLKR